MQQVSAGEALLDHIEDFFSNPEVTTAVGSFLNSESKNFAHFAETDDPAVHENVALFKKYGALVEGMMAQFCAKEGIELLAVAKACLKELERCDGAPSPYICVSYIAAAVDLEQFAQLVGETNAIVHYDEMDVYEAGEDDDTDDAEEGIDDDSAER